MSEKMDIEGREELNMRLVACITTRNRPSKLDTCLQALWSSRVKPYSAIVSDDSPEDTVRQENSQVVEKYPDTTYLIGPRSGVCANRNNAVNAVTEADYVAFIDDDIHVDSDFIACALAQYDQMDLEQRGRTILSGISRDQYGHETSPATKLSFMGYFCSSDVPEAVAIHATVFPYSFFSEEQWDENIFFGYEDAELCLRALKRDYHILYCPELRAFHTQKELGTLAQTSVRGLTDYNIYINAARLYVGVKRYKDLFPNPFKLAAFLIVYFGHMSIYLLRGGALHSFPLIVQRSHLGELW